MQRYNAVLPPEWSHNNPIDVLGDAPPERYMKAVDIALADASSNGLLVVLAPQALTDPTQTAEQLKQRAADNDKPILASWMGGADVAAGDNILNRANVPTFPYPDTAARVFCLMWKYSYALRGLYETPALPPQLNHGDSAREHVAGLIEAVRRAGRTILTEVESKRVLAEYGIPTVETHIATDVEQAIEIAHRIGYPVVLKLYSDTVTHKTDVGGVQLNVCDRASIERAFEGIRAAASEKVGAGEFQGVTVQPMVRLEGYELIIGSTIDPQFGPVLAFGSGGQLVEVFSDRALALPPLNTTLARRMMEQTRIFRALRGVRGRKGVDLAALEDLMVRFSHLVAEQRWIQEVDVNPLLASPERLVALDARVVIHPVETPADRLPTLAVRPYPVQYVREAELKDGTKATIRPIRPEDEPAMVRFHEGLSDRSVYFRYFHMLNLTERVAHERLTRICFIDYDREMALVAEVKDPSAGESRIIGVGRLTQIHATHDAEFAILVTDQHQGKGLGTALLGHLLDIARAEGVQTVMADMLSENRDMQRVCEHYGFKVDYVDQTQLLHAALAMGPLVVGQSTGT
jgi:acetyltransferase